MRKTIKNKTKRHNKHNHKKGCGCKKNSFFTKKNRRNSRVSRRNKMNGGSNSASFQPFQNSQNQYYYDVNNHNNDPADPNALTASRNMPNMVVGGKSKKIKKSRGGNPLMSNSLMSFGNFDGSSIGKDIISGTPLASNSVISQPSFTSYNGYRTPIA